MLSSWGFILAFFRARLTIACKTILFYGWKFVVMFTKQSLSINEAVFSWTITRYVDDRSLGFLRVIFFSCLEISVKVTIQYYLHLYRLRL